METTVKERVADGAEWLDNSVPDWRDRINLDLLELESPHFCVLGQVFQVDADLAGWSSGYSYAINHLMYIDDVHSFGFSCAYAGEYSELNAAWRAVLS